MRSVVLLFRVYAWRRSQEEGAFAPSFQYGKERCHWRRETWFEGEDDS
jgi:hypothetical protein